MLSIASTTPDASTAKMIAPHRTVSPQPIWEDPALSPQAYFDRMLGLEASLPPRPPNPPPPIFKYGAHTSTPTPGPTLEHTQPTAQTETQPKDITVPIPRLMVIPQSRYRRYGSMLRYRPDAYIPEAKHIPRTTFRLRTPLEGKHGVPLSMLAHEGEEALRAAVWGADEPVLEELVARRERVAYLRIVVSALCCGGREIAEAEWMLEWPAYPELEFVARLFVARYDGAGPPRPISRLALAQQVAKAFEGFVEVSDSDGPGWSLRIIACGAELTSSAVQEAQRYYVSCDAWEAQFRFEKGALSFGGLWLVSLVQIESKVFEAEVRHTRVGDGF
ncbi:hypothetical protein OH77DRAFT_355737 [Trametes cingulata]|nr:hypothetical protein OH77DRAFT_355737 [Trametes cingulata]